MEGHEVSVAVEAGMEGAFPAVAQILDGEQAADVAGAAHRAAQIGAPCEPAGQV